MSGNSVEPVPAERVDEVRFERLSMKSSHAADLAIPLKLVRYVGDHPVVSSTLEILAHTSQDSCHLCAFRREDE